MAGAAKTLDDVVNAVDGVTSALRVLTGEVTVMKTDIGSMKTDIGSMKTDIGSMNGEIVQIKSRLDSQAVGIRAALDAVADEVGTVKARVEGQGDLAAEVRRLADGQTALVNAITQLVNIEARVSRIEAVVFHRP